MYRIRKKLSYANVTATLALRPKESGATGRLEIGSEAVTMD